MTPAWTGNASPSICRCPSSLAGTLGTFEGMGRLEFTLYLATTPRTVSFLSKDMYPLLIEDFAL